ncbi:MAG: cupin domain-containing protein [Halieaceae bacterium]|jgi:50S ribosomal protein L16 3-hydroxylase|nr:cupin domain-containing protein [Halieaceae bacterium]
MGSHKLNLDISTFLADYWQQQPLFIPGAISGFQQPMTPDELAGLSLEEDVESRIVEQVDQSWQAYHGPFEVPDFTRTCPWTLLVQAVDHYVPAVAELRKLLDFIPSWRLDDVMVSYASNEGSVGPHYDNYDVFLIQGEGQRKWKTGQSCDSSSPILEHPELRLVAEFNCEAEYILNPGDILYLPPAIAHWGVSIGDSMSFSVGFRAPRLNDMLSRRLDQLLERMDPELFFSDPGLTAANRPGEIRTEDIERVEHQLAAILDTRSDHHWLGSLVTEPRYDTHLDDQALATAKALLLGRPSSVALNSAAKLAWQQQDNGIAIFANGEPLTYSQQVLPLVISLCDSLPIEGQALTEALSSPESGRLLDQLLDNGCLDVD